MVRGRQKLKIVKDTFQYIPILKTLQALLNQPDILSEVISWFSCIFVTQQMLCFKFTHGINWDFPFSGLLIIYDNEYRIKEYQFVLRVKLKHNTGT